MNRQQSRDVNPNLEVINWVQDLVEGNELRIQFNLTVPSVVVTRPRITHTDLEQRDGTDAQ